MKAWTQRSVVLLATLGATLAFSDFDGPAPVAWRWAQSTAASPGGAPQVDGESVFVAVGGRMYGLEKATGNQIWRFPVAEPLDGSFRNGCQIGQGLVVGGCDNKTIYALDMATGKLKWQFAAQGNLTGAPQVVGNHVVFGYSPNYVMSLKIENGAPAWEKPVQLKGNVYPNMSSFQDNAIILTNTPSIVSINASTQKINYEIPAGSLSGLSGTVVFGDNIYLNTGYYLTCLRAASGSKRWDKRMDQNLAYFPAVSPTGVAVVSLEGVVYTFDLNGNFIFKKGIDLGSSPVAAPAFVGKMVVVGTQNGTLNVLDPRSGETAYNYLVPPLFKGLKVAADSGGGGKGFGGNNKGGGGNPGSQGADKPTDDEIKYVAIAGQAVGSGDTMLVQVRDGSLIAFDKRLGVDLTAPSVKLAWPTLGEQISGQPPLELTFLIEDAASGVNPSTVAITINGQAYAGKFSRDGYLTVKVSAVGTNRPLMDGRAEIVVTASDWLGNKAEMPFSLSIDNTLPPSGSQPNGAADKNNSSKSKNGGKGGGLGGG